MVRVQVGEPDLTRACTRVQALFISDCARNVTKQSGSVHFPRAQFETLVAKEKVTVTRRPERDWSLAKPRLTFAPRRAEMV